jgi:hypothetical protein
MTKKDFPLSGHQYAHEFMSGFWRVGSEYDAQPLKTYIDNPVPRCYDLFLMYCMADV